MDTISALAHAVTVQDGGLFWARSLDEAQLVMRSSALPTAAWITPGGILVQLDDVLAVEPPHGTKVLMTEGQVPA